MNIKSIQPLEAYQNEIAALAEKELLFINKKLRVNSKDIEKKDIIKNLSITGYNYLYRDGNDKRGTSFFLFMLRLGLLSCTKKAISIHLSKKIVLNSRIKKDKAVQINGLLKEIIRNEYKVNKNVTISEIDAFANTTTHRHFLYKNDDNKKTISFKVLLRICIAMDIYKRKNNIITIGRRK